VTAFLRFADETIYLRCEITAPDDLVVLDPTLVEAVDVSTGLKPGGSILINSGRDPAEYTALRKHYQVATVDANTIARNHGLGSKTQPIVNTAILGAFAAYTKMVSLESVCRAIEEEVPFKAEANVKAAVEAAHAVRSAVRMEVEHA
jgi:pyruvate ferredoxin oxidoreductase gamma subunit/2-oxoisovalerate ferredoxin oxidoreductase gamma subunit